MVEMQMIYACFPDLEHILVHKIGHYFMNVSLTESVKNLLDSGYVVCGLFIDLEKAFDMVKHNILCEKLPYYGFGGKIEVLIKSYISNRK